MDDDVQVQVQVSPLLLADLVRQTVIGDGLAAGVPERDCLVSIVTPDHLGDVRSRIVIMLGDSVEGDVRVIIDGRESDTRAIRADQLRDFIIDLAHDITTASA